MAGFSGKDLLHAGAEATPLVAAGDVDRLVALFERIASEEMWQPGDQLLAHVGRSTYFGLWTLGEGRHEKRLVGGMQLVRPDLAGSLPCCWVWPELDFAGRTDIAHIAVLAVEPQWRGRFGGLFWLLAAEMWRHCVLTGVEELWLEATPRTLRCYRRLGWPLQVRGDLRMHWGEPCYVCSLDVCQVAGELARRAVRSPAYRSVLLRATAGVGEEPRVPLNFTSSQRLPE
jgi:hypothetical protein